jgi:hypothetical protein
MCRSGVGCHVTFLESDGDHDSVLGSRTGIQRDELMLAFFCCL